MGELAKFLFNHQTEYQADDKNVIGATTDKTLRTITAPAGATTNYVRKFGKAYAIADITNAVIATPRSDGGGVNKWWFEFYNQNDTLLGTVKDENGGSAFVDGTAETSTLVYIKLVWKSGTVAITDGDTINLTTDVDAPLVVNLSGESIATGSLVWHLAESGSTYYQSDSTDLTNIENYMWGGYRHTPVAGSEKYPYFHPVAADTALGARVIVHVLDSKYYQIDEYAISNVNTIWQAALGETPHLITVIGASEYRDVEHDGNNSDTVYVSKTGVNAAPNTGSFQLPYLSHSHAFTNRGARTYLNTMDSNSYNESFTISANFTLEPVYSKVPIITYESVVNANFTLTAATINIYGYEFDGNGINGQGIYLNNVALNFSGNVKNNKFIQFVRQPLDEGQGVRIVCNSFNGNIEKNISCNNGNEGMHIKPDNNSSGNIEKNICYGNNGTGIRYYPTTGTITGNVKNNICYGNDGSGIMVFVSGTYNGLIENNTCYKNTYSGFQYVHSGAFGGTIRNLICWENEQSDVKKAGGGAITITNINYSTNDGFTIGAGCITTDPKICKTTFPYKLGIAANSGAYKTDSTTNNMGARTFGLNITADDVTINGFIFDGLDSYVHGLIITSNTDYTGLDVKWCRFKDFQGIAVDLWDNDANLTADLLNCIFDNNGQGLALAYGGNTIQECLFYKNSKINIWLDRSGHTINHCVIYNAEYGLYVDSNGGGIICKNSNINENSIYGIYSEIAMAITYCNITDAVTSNVDITHSSNIVNNPLFINTTDGSEDFHIKTVEGGSKLESPCKQKADDGYDIGAWLVDYAIIQDSWEKYVLEYNPKQMPEEYKRKGGLSFKDGKGNYSGYAQARRLVMPFDFSGIMGDENQRAMLRHFAEREMGRESEYTAAECEFLVSLLPTNYHGQGSNAVIDASAKTLTDSSQTWPIYNVHKGRFCTVIFESQDSGNINAAAKTVTKAGAGWTVDEWKGYYFPYDGFYWYILSNTATILTLSDPNGDLKDNADFDFDITKQFKILKSSKTVLNLRDDDSELVDGSYDFYIDYILSNVVGADFGYKQNQYNYENEETKQDYAITYEEID